MTVTKVVEGCVYIRRRYYGILLRVGGEFELSALSPLFSDLSLALSSNATTLNHLIRLRGSQGIQIWKQRTVHARHILCVCVLGLAEDLEARVLKSSPQTKLRATHCVRRRVRKRRGGGRCGANRVQRKTLVVFILHSKAIFKKS